jgi:hypothetical protein
VGRRQSGLLPRHGRRGGDERPLSRAPTGTASGWAPRAALALLLAFASGVSGCRSALPPEEEITPAGERLARELDAMQVEKHWIAGHHVNWRTGDPDGRPVPLEGKHTHCSAFAAAAASRLGVDLLRPPDHNQVLLANAQCEWLTTVGPAVGWKPVAGPLEAQRLANRGWLVLACYVSPDPELPGHIAIVRPAALTRQHIDSQGPQITQAGVKNYRSASLAEGFRHHPDAWRERAVKFYGHPVPP